MKCGIFCLVVLWAFKTVFAHHGFKDPEFKHQGTADRFNAVFDKSDGPVWIAASVVQGSKDTKDYIGDCMSEAETHYAYHQKYTTSAGKCEKCYEEADKTENLMVADTCCDKAVAAFVKVNQLKDDRAMACIKKFVELGKLSPNEPKSMPGQV